MDINPKQFVNPDKNRNLTFSSNRDELDKDDDDPLSIEDISITLIGIVLAFMTVFLPSISVLLDRPLLHKHEVISNKF